MSCKYFLESVVKEGELRVWDPDTVQGGLVQLVVESLVLQVVEDQVGVPPGHPQHEDHGELAVADLQDVLDGDLSWDDQLLETLPELVFDLHRGRVDFVVLVLCRQLEYSHRQNIKNTLQFSVKTKLG